MTDLSPRCLGLKAAAGYCGISAGSLLNHGPKPVRIGRRRVWDVRDLDRWIDGLNGAIVHSEQEAEERRALAALEEVS